MTRSSLLLVLAMVGIAGADPKPPRDDGMRAYAGQLVISPDPAPSTKGELAAHLKANATKDRHYELIKGPPWDINLVGVLPKDASTTPVTLVFADADDKKLATLQSIDVASKDGLVIAHTTATTAAGFEANKTYVVRLMRNTRSLARATLKLRN